PWPAPPPHTPSLPTRRSSDLGLDVLHALGAPLLFEHVDHFGRVVLVHLAAPSLDVYLHVRAHVNRNRTFRNDRSFYLKQPFRRSDRKSTRLNSSHVSISYAVF